MDLKKQFHFEYEIYDEKVKIKGIASYRGMVFRFSLNLQKDESLRGRITVFLPTSEDCISFSKKQRYSKGAATITQQFRELNCPKGSKKEIIEAYLRKVILDIFKDNERKFLMLQKKVVTIETITLGLAFELNGVEYINKKFPKGTFDSKRRYREQLSDIFAVFSTKTMVFYANNPKAAKALLKGQSEKTIKLVHDFWDYYIAKEKYNMDNPFIRVENPKSESRKRKKATKRQILPQNVQQNLNKNIIEQHGGKECGIALVESNFPIKDVCSKNWKDYRKKAVSDPDIDEEDYCTIHHERPDLLIAVHDYSRPPIPVAETVLDLRYSDLLKKFSKEELAEMPIVSQSSNPKKAMTPAALQQAIKEALINAGIKDAQLKAWKESRNDPVSSRILKETYKENLVNKCHLSSDSGTYHFLLGESFQNDTTSTNYVNYTCDSGQKRLYNYLRRLRPASKHIGSCLVRRDTEEGEVVEIHPEASNEAAGAVIEIKVFPGEEVSFASRSGMNISKLSAEEDTESPDIYS